MALATRPSPYMDLLVSHWSDEDHARLRQRCEDRNVHVFDIRPTGTAKAHECVVCGVLHTSVRDSESQWRIQHA